jgi:hypothetical protein
VDPSSLLLTVGKFAGIGGIALGVLLLIFREVIRKNIFPNLAQVQGYRIIRLIVVLTFCIAAFGIAAWVYVTTNHTRLSGPLFHALTPKLIAPENEQKLTVFPRLILYSWQPVDGAARYTVEVEFFDSSTNEWKPLPAGTGRIESNTTTATSGFVGAQPGRWKVTPINSLNERGQASEWRTFIYQS